MSRFAIIVTGLPASGKTTIGKIIAEKLGINFLDKDDFLEKRFDRDGVGDLLWRQELSQKSNVDFQNAAIVHSSVVLISHWRPLNDKSSSGTPTEWLNNKFPNLIEVFCDCPQKEAVARFIERSRHKGHCDKDRSKLEINKTFSKYSENLPLKLGSVIKIETSLTNNSQQVLEELLLELALKIDGL